MLVLALLLLLPNGSAGKQKDTNLWRKQMLGVAVRSVQKHRISAHKLLQLRICLHSRAVTHVPTMHVAPAIRQRE
jgi:hypothetical protein